MSSQRNYDTEIMDATDQKYAYSFDFDVMHPFMVRSFEPFFRNGSLLELGSYKGDFTRRFLDRFDDVTCVEAAGRRSRKRSAGWEIRRSISTRCSKTLACLGVMTISY